MSFFFKQIYIVIIDKIKTIYYYFKYGLIPKNYYNNLRRVYNITYNHIIIRAKKPTRFRRFRYY